jgi:catechol 2,3-dioxygenase-like lactoylglutathione lyase family enzyme
MVDHIGFAVRDLSKTRAFYTAALAPLGLAVGFEKDTVIAAPSANNRFHCVLGGITPEAAAGLFSPSVPNPNR